LGKIWVIIRGSLSKWIPMPQPVSPLMLFN
jgi:hypothetical protein